MGMLDGKVTVITGGASGIGAESVRLFAREGARVMVGDIDEAGGEASAAAARADGGEALFQGADVSQATAVRELVAAAVERWGGLDVMFSNAGVFYRTGGLADCSEEEFDKTIATNLRGTFLCLRAAIPPMIARGGGSIIATSSIAAEFGLPLSAAYAASKAGIGGLVRVAAVEYGQHKIRVNAIQPGLIVTPQSLADPRLQAETQAEQTALFAASQPIPRAGDPLDIARTAAWLASDLSTFVTGQEIVVDGGFLPTPGLG